MQKKPKSGFTLIELVVVLAILAILAAIAVPHLSGFRQSAGDRVCQTNRQTILRSYQFHIVSGETLSLEFFLQLQGEDHCPAGGRLTAVDEEIVCDIHPLLSQDDTENEEESGEVPYL